VSFLGPGHELLQVLQDIPQVNIHLDLLDKVDLFTVGVVVQLRNQAAKLIVFCWLLLVNLINEKLSERLNSEKALENSLQVVILATAIKEANALVSEEFCHQVILILLQLLLQLIPVLVEILVQ
jgi:hypothetical protein